MHENTDDTVPHMPAPAVGAPAADVVFGDTVLREALPDEGAGSRAPLPQLPAALRPHHRIRVASEAPFALDRPVVLGRRPRGGRVPATAAPHLVAVESPDGGISATHLELHEEGLVVVATDQHTLNGSRVHVPGAPVQTLRDGRSMAVLPGTRIDLGEGVEVEVLAPEPPSRRGALA